ncbi:MAG: hypothetical protein WC635_08630 [Bacteriovorax sp.]|jgi:hypothetical protein
MMKIFWKFFVTGLLCNCLLLTNIYSADTTDNTATVNTTTLATPKTLKELEAADAVLAEKNRLFKEAEAGINSPLIKQKEADLAAVISRQKAQKPLDDPDQEQARVEKNQQELDAAKNELAVAKTPKIDAAYLNKTRSEADQAQVAKNDLTNQAIKEGIAAKTSKPAELNITGKEAVLKVIKDATDKVELSDQYTQFNNAELYKEYRRRDIVMLVISQITSRLKSCKEPEKLPPDMITAIGGGAAFVTGEVAEYQSSEKLQKELEHGLAYARKENLQIGYFYALRTAYLGILAEATNKQKIRDISTTAFKNAAAQATAEDNEDQAYANACRDQNNAMTDSGKNQGDGFNMMQIAIGAALIAAGNALNGTPCGCGSPLIAAGAAAIALGLIGKGNGESCKSGGSATHTNIINRQMACDQLGEFVMFNTAEAPTTTSSKVIRDRCLQTGETVKAGAGQGCNNHSSSGAGPYGACDMASEAYKRNMVACPVDVLKDSANPAIANLSAAGISEVAGSALVKNASYEVSRALDLRMASPAQRGFVWEAFSSLAKNASDNTQLMITKIKEQLDKLERIIHHMESFQKGVELKDYAAVQKGFNTTVTPNKDKDIVLNKATDCMTGPNGNKCQSVAEALESSESFNNFPPDLKEASLAVASGLNLFNQKAKISGIALADAASNISKQKNAINEIFAKKKSVQEALSKKNDSRQNQGSDTKNFKSLLSSLSSKNPNGVQRQSSFGSSGDSIGSGDTNKNEPIEDASASTASGSKNPANPYSNNFFTNTSPKKSTKAFGQSGANSDTPEAQTNPEASVLDSENARLLSEAIEARNKNNSGKYNSSENNSLFEKVTNAYIRNYDKLLTRKSIKLESK